MAALFLLQTLVGAASAALPRRPRQLLRHRPRPGPALQPGAHLARAAGDLLGLDVVPGRRHLPRADDRRARAARSRRRSPTRCSARSRWSSSAAWSASSPTCTAGSTGVGAWFGNQGFEYLDLGRFWQVLLVDRPVLLGRDPLPRPARAAAARAPRQHAVAVLLRGARDPGLLRGRACWSRPGEHFTVTDFWRFWVVHLWVEDFLELFTTVMVAYIFVLLGVVRERVALTVIYLDIILYSVGGVIGTMHHLYFSGAPAEHMALGAFFSAAEVIPLTFLTVEAWSFLQLGARQESRSRDAVPAPLGGDVPGRGRLLELPRRRHLRLPDQPADRLLLRDRHRADRQPRARRDDGRLRHARRRPGAVLPALPDPGRALVRPRGAQSASGRSTSGSPGCASPRCFPLGMLQLYQSVNDGYFEARTLELPDQRHQPAARVGAAPGRRALHRRAECCRCSTSAGWGCGTRSSA